MKPYSKKILSVMLLTGILTTFASCGGDTKETTPAAETTTATTAETAETAETKPTPDLPDADYEGYNIKFLHWDCDNVAATLAISPITADEITGEALSDAVYQRNMKVAETYNVTFTNTYKPQAELLSLYKRFVTAGENDFDIVFPLAYTANAVMADGLAMDLFSLPYIDWTDPWWDTNSVEELSLNGKLFIVNSDFTLSDKNSTACMVFNKKLHSNYNMENLYDLVTEGKWTIDKMLSLSTDISVDLNGDGNYDEEDLYGIVGSSGFSYQLLHGSDCWYVRKDADDVPELVFLNDRTIDVCDKIMSIGEDKSLFYNSHLRSTTPDATRIEMFITEHGLFSNSNISGVCALREMDSDFGVLPMPKYNEAQENYYCFSSIYSGVVTTVPVTCPDTDRAAVVLCALAADSADTVISEYRNATLKGKNSRDEDSADMIDIIIGNRAYDWGEFMLLGDFPTKFLNWFQNPTQGIASLYAANEKALQTDLEKVLSIGK